MDVNTEIKFVKNRKLDLQNGQILLSIKADEKPFMMDANNNIVTANDGNVDVKISEHMVFVTVTKGEATVIANGEEKKVFEGRQLKVATGGEPANIDSVIKWAKEMRKKLKEQNKLNLSWWEIKNP